MTNTNAVLGVVILMRHGDRQGFYQNPNNYTASHTTITPLGEQQAFQLGQLVKSRYLNASSPNAIPSLASVTSTGLFSGTAITVVADNGGEGGVILDSVTAAFQGIFPPSPSSNTTLANGQVITSPLNGYQYVAVESINPTTNISFEPWTNCPNFDKWTQSVYASDSFKQQATKSQSFFDSIKVIVEPRNVTLSNFYNVFDYLNVESIHNATVAAKIDASTLAQARDLANFHEHALFTDTSLDVAGRAILPQIISTLNSFTSSSTQSRMTYMGGAYKPFLSISNMIGIEDQAYGMVNYASALSFELRQSTSSSSTFEVRVNFKNGTQDPDFKALNMFGMSSVDMSLDDFTQRLQPHLLTTLKDWCKACDNTDTRGCNTVYEASRGTGGSLLTTYGQHSVSPLAAGFIGACISFVIASVLFALLALRGRRKKRQPTSSDDDNTNASGSMEKKRSF